MATAMVWRREYDDERPESFSDSQSRRDRGRRFVGAASVAFFLFLLGAIGFGVAAIFAQLPLSDRTQFGYAAGFSLVLTFLMGLALLKMRKNIDK